MNQTAQKNLLRRLTLLSFGLSALFVILARIYVICCSDIVLMYTAWPEVLEILTNILECAIYGIAYAYLIYATYKFPDGGLSPFVLVYFSSVLFKYIANYLVTWITDTGMSASYLIENLSYILIYTAMELAQAGLVLLITYFTMRTYHRFISRQIQIAKNIPGGQEITTRTYVFPITKLFSLQNPLQKCAFLSGAMVSAFKIVSRLIYDISYGWPTSVVDALWMITYYMFDLFVGFAVCLLITYLLIQFDHDEQK